MQEATLELRVTERALRYYEQVNLLAPIHCPNSSRRCTNSNDDLVGAEEDDR